MNDKKNKEFYDEIIDSLLACQEESSATYVARDILLEFYRPAENRKNPVKEQRRLYSKNNDPSRQIPSPSPAVPVLERQRTSSPVQEEAIQESASLMKANIPEGSSPETDMGLKTEEMEFPALKKTVSICSRCPLCRTRTNTVFGDGNEHADLLFIGEGPGADEDARGLPFVGKAGELLTKMIQAMGYTRDQVYIGNIVKCRPPGNRTPEEEEIKACLPYIQRQIELIQPKAIVLLGATPLKGLFNRTGITRARGTFLDYKGIPAMPTFHPAFLLRNPGAKMDVWKDLQQVMKVLGKELPKRKNQ